MESPDWDSIFAGVVLACHLDYSVIAQWTPRQLDAVSRESRRQVIDTDANERTTDGAVTAGKRSGAPMGINIDKYPCWKPYPGENDDDPFSVPREIVKERWYCLLYEAAKQGGLEEHGVRKVDVDRGDMTSLRNLFDKTWGENCEKFEKLKAEREHGLRHETNGTGQHAGTR